MADDGSSGSVSCGASKKHFQAESRTKGSKSYRAMSATVLEQLRAEQEAIESYERAIVSILSEKPRNVRACWRGSDLLGTLISWIELTMHSHVLEQR